MRVCLLYILYNHAALKKIKFRDVDSFISCKNIFYTLPGLGFQELRDVSKAYTSAKTACTIIDGDFVNIKELCIDLTGYEVETRYPYPFEIDIEDMLKAIKDLEFVRDFIKTGL